MAKISSLLHFSTSVCVLNPSEEWNSKGLRGGFFFFHRIDFFFHLPDKQTHLEVPTFSACEAEYGTLTSCCKLQALAVLFMENHSAPTLGKCHFDWESFVCHMLFQTHTSYAVCSVTPVATRHEWAQKGRTIVHHQHVEG